MNDHDRAPGAGEENVSPLGRWAARGTRRGFDAVIASAQVRARELRRLDDTVARANNSDNALTPTPTNAHQLVNRREETTMSDSLEPIAIAGESDAPVAPVAIDMQPAPTRVSRRNRGIAGLGLAALLGVGGYAALVSQADGGARSPEAAVEQLVDAVSNEDALAAVDVLAPDEVASMRASLERAASKAEQFEIVEDSARPLTGIDIDVDDLTTEVETLAEGFAKVTITGGIVDAAIEPSGLARRVRDTGVEPNHEQVDLAESGGPNDLALFVIAVERGGGWYVSPAYTGMEYAREIWNQDPEHAPVSAPAFGTADVAQLGADSPEAAVRDALDAWRVADWVRMTELAPPGELPVWEYRDLITAAARDVEPDFTVERFDVQATVDGARATATITGNGSLGGGGTWQVGGTCPETFVFYATESDTESFCLAGNAGRSLVTNLVFFGAGPTEGAITVELVQHGGRWFVSPTRTALDALDAFVESVDERFVANVFDDYRGIEPDGTLQLGVPVDVPAGVAFDFTIYEFEGTAGTEVVGEFEYAEGDDSELFCCGGGDARIVGPDGETLGDVGDGYPFTLPEDGRYLVVVRPYGRAVGFTLWDADDAPEGIVDRANTSTVQCDATGCLDTIDTAPVVVSECIESPNGIRCTYFDDEGNVIRVEERPAEDGSSATTAPATIDTIAATSSSPASASVP